MLVLLAALVMAVFAPAFHYHQFGEPTRMARDAGLSAMLLGGVVVAVFGTIRTVRREIESRTLEMALTHSVSRGAFLLSKVAGVFLALLIFETIVFGTALAVVEGAAVGGEIAKQSGDIARLWGPCFALGVAAIVLPLAVGAALNRFAGCRFVLSSFCTAAAISAGAVVWLAFRDASLALRLVPAALPIVVFSLMLLASAAAFSVRFKANAAAGSVAVVAALLFPALGNYYLSDALSNGGAVSWGYVGLSALAAAPVILFFLFLGIRFFNGRDIA